VVFPQGTISADPDELREYILGIEAIGFDHVVVPDHVLGVDRSAHPEWSRPYDIDSRLHEPLVMFGFLAAFSGLELVTSVLVLSQRQTALVAKQATEIALLTRGRFRLGVGAGWNAPEFEALGARFEGRGERLDEQIEVLRRLWSEPVVTFEGESHTLRSVGISPRPGQPIPVWIAAEKAPRALRRVGRLADGWMAMGKPVPEVAAQQRVIRDAAVEAGRDPDAIGLQAWVDVNPDDTSSATDDIRGWTGFGATHIALGVEMPGRVSTAEHLERAARAYAAFG